MGFFVMSLLYMFRKDLKGLKGLMEIDIIRILIVYIY